LIHIINAEEGRKDTVIFYEPFLIFFAGAATVNTLPSGSRNWKKTIPSPMIRFASIRDA